MSHAHDTDGSSEEPEEPPSRSELKLWQQAIDQRWPIPGPMRARMMKLAWLALDECEDELTGKVDVRRLSALMRAILGADKLNQEQEKRDQAIPEHHVHEHRFAQLSDDELIARAAELARRAGGPGPAPAP